MNPILLKAVRRMLTAQQRASDAGVTLAPEELNAFISEETNGRFGLKDAQKIVASIDTDVGARNLGRSAANGFLMNWGDELLGALPEFLGGGEAAKEEMRLRGEMFHRAHPKTDIAAGIVGAIAPTLIPVGAAARGAATVGQAVLRGAGVGAGAGLLSGAGEGEDLQDRVTRGATGAVLGGAFGAALPGIVASVKALRSPVIRASGRIAHAIEQSGGVEKMRAVARDMVALGRGDDVMLADLSPHLRQAADFSANASDDVLVPLAERVRARQADASERLLGDVRAHISGGGDAAARRAELEASRRGWASGPEGYAGLRETNPNLDVADLASVLKQPKVSRALADAHEAGLIGRVPQSPKEFSFEKLQAIKEDLDDAVSEAFRRGKGNLGARLGEARDMVVDHMHAKVPGYSGVAREYARRIGLENALAAGEEAWTIADTRGLAKQVGGLTPEQLAEFRTGMASRLIAQLRSAATNRDEAARLLNASPALEDRLRVVFGDRATFEQFMRRVGVEGELAKMRGAVAGSATARRLQAAGFDPLELGATMATGGSAGLLRSALGAVARKTTGAVRRETAREMGPFLMLQGAPNIEALLSRFATRDPLLSRIWTATAPAAAGRVGSLFE